MPELIEPIFGDLLLQEKVGRLTLGICIKNCAGTIAKTIDMIATQNYPKECLEAIVVDDGSVDETLAVATGLLSKTAIVTKAFKTGGKGLGFARQLVVNNAVSEYILWVDEGLIFSDGYFSEQYLYMEKHPEIAQARPRWGWCEKNSLVSTLENLMVASYEAGNRRKDTSLKLRGIGGCISRVKALRQVNGFDCSIKGAGEDIEVANKLRSRGWKLGISEATFYYQFKDSWKALWRQQYWYGYGMHYVQHKHKESLKVWTMLPIVGLFVGSKHSFSAYKLTKRKASFLLPVHFFFKRAAWYAGFLRSHQAKYGHSLE
jgi:glycosyltransferase involved in cell wall biosynthesis